MVYRDGMSMCKTSLKAWSKTVNISWRLQSSISKVDSLIRAQRAILGMQDTDSLVDAIDDDVLWYLISKGHRNFDMFHQPTSICIKDNHVYLYPNVALPMDDAFFMVGFFKTIMSQIHLHVFVVETIIDGDLVLDEYKHNKPCTHLLSRLSQLLS
jgi:hypothetical protein